MRNETDHFVEGICVKKSECEKDFSRDKLNKKGSKCGSSSLFAWCGNFCKNSCQSLRKKSRCSHQRYQIIILTKLKIISKIGVIAAASVKWDIGEINKV